MKLRNKDDGRVREFGIDETKSFPYYLRDELGNTYWAKTLKEIADKWEEMEEPKKYWYITGEGDICRDDIKYSEWIKERKSIGNYFETEKEAELAVRKLKAWKRLKDKGFRFIEGYLDNNDDFIIKAKLGHVGLIDQPDVHLLFGGEE